MEKQAKPRSNILQFLPRAASAVYFQNLPFSPGRDLKKAYGHGHKGFSGPIVSIIPDEARRKPRNDDKFGSQEPTSPKISCMGQIKHKKKKIKKATSKTNNNRVSPPKKPLFFTPRESKKKPAELGMKRMFSVSKLPARNSDASDSECEISGALPDTAPALSQMKRFSSGRDAFSGFDWTAQTTPQESCDRRSYYSDEEKGESDEAEEEVINLFSAPIVPSQPRKEVNLWERRTMNPPKHLQINP